MGQSVRSRAVGMFASRWKVRYGACAAGETGVRLVSGVDFGD